MSDPRTDPGETLADSAADAAAQAGTAAAVVAAQPDVDRLAKRPMAFAALAVAGTVFVRLILRRLRRRESRTTR